MKYHLECTKCGKVSGRGEFRCSCGGPLRVNFDLSMRRFEEILGTEESIARYSAFLPVDRIPQLHIGWTPISAVEAKDKTLFFKLENLNMSGSFKDRGAVVAVQRAKEMGYSGISVDSSGNSAIAFSLIGKVLNVRVIVFIPETARPGKKKLLRFLGAEVHEVPGGREMVNEEALRSAEKNLYVGHWWSPYFLEGIKTLSFETFEQIGVVDEVFVPVGSGSLILGIEKGFRALIEMGVLKEMPRLIAVQGCDHSEICETLGAEKLEGGSKMADGIAIDTPPRRSEIIKVVKKSGGEGVIVNDSEIREALLNLKNMGFLVEPTSAVVYAAFKRRGCRGKRALFPLTGSGMKLLDDLVNI